MPKGNERANICKKENKMDNMESVEPQTEKETLALEKEEVSQAGEVETKANLENENAEDKTATKEKSKKSAFLQFVIFALFSASAGIIQILSFECLYHWIGWNNWWATYLISLTLSVIWNFTFNRKFTFKSSSNIPVAMTLVFLYYCAFTPISVFGGNALEGIGWNGTLVTVIMMLFNFATEFFFDKYVTFNDKIVQKIANKFKRNKKTEE